MASVDVGMDVEIVVTHVADSTLVGTEQRFRKRRVLIGRRSANDVRFDKNRDLTVSGYHAELFLSEGNLFIQDVGSRNGTFINDRPINEPTILLPEDIVTLGVPGAKLQARWQNFVPEESITNDNFTTAESSRAIGMSTLGRFIDDVVVKERSRSRRAFLALAFALAFVVMISAGYVLFRESDIRKQQEQLRASTERQKQELVETKQAFRDTELKLAERLTAAERTLQGIRDETEERVDQKLQDLEKQLGQIRDKITEEDARVARLMIEIQERNAALERMQRQSISEDQKQQLTKELQEQIESLREKLSETQTIVRQSQTRQETWSDIVEKYRESIFLCLGYSEDTGQGIGTGFAVNRDGLIATNAHVIKTLQQFRKQFVIQNTTGKVFSITKMVAHPDHTDIRSPDVGLIQIDLGGEKVTPLPLASQQTLEQLRLGTQLGTLGFPGELTEAYLADFRPTAKRVRTVQATFKDGWIGRITNYNFENDDIRFTRYIQHSASVSPGTSGSPMFNLRGEVVAINSGTLQVQSDLTVEVDGKKTTTKISNPSAAEIAFAVRADELRIILEAFAR